MDEMTIDILAKSEIAPLVWAFKVKNAVNYHANVINRNGNAERCHLSGCFSDRCR